MIYLKKLELEMKIKQMKACLENVISQGDYCVDIATDRFENNLIIESGKFIRLAHEFMSLCLQVEQLKSEVKK